MTSMIRSDWLEEDQQSDAALIAETESGWRRKGGAKLVAAAVLVGVGGLCAAKIAPRHVATAKSLRHGIVEKQALPSFSLSSAQTGCTNWQDITLDTANGKKLTECANMCVERGDECVAFNFQTKDGCDGGGRGHCILFSGMCENTFNECWNLYTPRETRFMLGTSDEWRDGYERADILYTEEDESSVLHKPEVGNGFVATVVGHGSVFAAGVFNGAATSPSHRAAIPAPLALYVEDGDLQGAALDLRSGAYTRRYLDFSVANADLRFYAHRSRRSLLVVDVITDSQEPTKVSLGGWGSAASNSDFSWSSSPGVGCEVWSGQTLEPEVPGLPTVRVAVAVSTAQAEVDVQAGMPVTFIAAIRTSLESDDPETDAQNDWLAANAMGTDALFAEHTAGWAELWNSGLEVSGDMEVARVVNSSLYFLLSSLRADAPYSISPGGLARGGAGQMDGGSNLECYRGHTFWDAETWMYPPLVLWHPDIAQSMLQYRVNTLPQAEAKAQSYGNGWQGAMFAWESAATGAETCPPGFKEGELEQHITGDIALAAQQLWYASGDTDWLQRSVDGLVVKTADFWASRANWEGDVAHLRNVMPPDEYGEGVDNSAYTNYVAKRNLLFAVEASNELGMSPKPEWQSTADSMNMPYDYNTGTHPEYDGYDGRTVKQADVVLLGYPLMMEMSADDRRRDLDYYGERLDPGAPCMSWSMHAVGYLEVGDLANAEQSFARSHSNSHAPFKVWSENPDSGCIGFLTGLGGFLQTMMFGLGGLRILSDQLVVNPTLIGGLNNIVIRGVRYHGAVLRISFDAGQLTILVESAPPAPAAVHFIDGVGNDDMVAQGESRVLPLGKVSIRVG